MKVVAAYLLAVLGGNNSPSADDIKAILGSVGIEAEDDKIELLLSQVKDRDLAELIACGREKMASLLPTGAGAATAVGAPPAVDGDASAAGPVAKEDKKEIIEESDDDMCFMLFD